MNDLVPVSPESTRSEEPTGGGTAAADLSASSTIQFALVNGEVLHISEPRAALRGAVCVACTEPLNVRKGKERSHHFSHKRKELPCPMDSEEVQQRVSARIKLVDQLNVRTSLTVKDQYRCGCSRTGPHSGVTWQPRWNTATIDPSLIAAVDTPVDLRLDDVLVAQLFVTDAKSDVLATSQHASHAQVTVRAVLEWKPGDTPLGISREHELCPLCIAMRELPPLTTTNTSLSPRATRIGANSVLIATQPHRIQAQGMQRSEVLEIHEVVDAIGVGITRALVVRSTGIIWAEVPIEQVLSDYRGAFDYLTGAAKEWQKRLERNHVNVEPAPQWHREHGYTTHSLNNRKGNRHLVEPAVRLRNEHPDVYAAFATLGCPPWTYKDDIETCHRTAIQQCHPDKNVGGNEQDQEALTARAAQLNVARDSIRTYQSTYVRDR